MHLMKSAEGLVATKVSDAIKDGMRLFAVFSETMLRVQQRYKIRKVTFLKRPKVHWRDTCISDQLQFFFPPELYDWTFLYI